MFSFFPPQRKNAALEAKAAEEEKKKQENNQSANSTESLPESTTENPSESPSYDADCPRPAIEQFPKPLIGPSARRHGGLIIHLALAVYTFIGLAIVCDEYFVSSLDRICEGNSAFFIFTYSVVVTFEDQAPGLKYP